MSVKCKTVTVQVCIRILVYISGFQTVFNIVGALV